MPSTVQFPEDLLTNTDYAGNYILFTAMNVQGGVDTRTLKFSESFSAVMPSTIALPIPQGLNTAYQNQWDNTSKNAMQAVAGKMGKQVIPAITAIAGQDSLTGMASEGMDQAKRFLDSAWSSLAGAATDIPTTLDAANQAGAGVVSEFTAAASTVPVIGDIVESAQFDIGKRSLQQTMTTYGGPGFRSFDWQFPLKPLSAVESAAADAIVNFFKVRSMPKQNMDIEYTRIYNIPDVFKIQLFTAFYESPLLFKIGHCACTNVAVTYGGDKFTTFAETHGPTEIQLQLSFKELELLNRQAVAAELGGATSTGMTWPQNTWNSPPADHT